MARPANPDVIRARVRSFDHRWLAEKFCCKNNWGGTDVEPLPCFFFELAESAITSRTGL